MSALRGAQLVDPVSLRVREGDLVWQEDRLLAAGQPEPPGGETIDGAGRYLALPGQVAHRELELSLLPGMPARSGESEAARRERYLRALDGPSLAAAARLGALQAALGGVTMVCALVKVRVDGALDLVASALAEVGLRAALALDVVSFRGWDFARGAIRQTVAFHRTALSRGDDRFRGLLGIGDSDRVQDPEAQLGEMVSEARREEMSSFLVLGPSRKGRRELFERGAVRPGSLVVSHPEMEAEEHAVIQDLHAFEVGAEEPHAMARGGDLAAALFDRPFGRFSAGAPVDLAVFEPELVAPLTEGTLAAHLQALTARNLRETVVAGCRVVGGGRPLRVDPGEVRAQAQEALRKTWARAA